MEDQQELVKRDQLFLYYFVIINPLLLLKFDFYNFYFKSRIIKEFIVWLQIIASQINSSMNNLSDFLKLTIDKLIIKLMVVQNLIDSSLLIISIMIKEYKMYL